MCQAGGEAVACRGTDSDASRTCMALEKAYRRAPSYLRCCFSWVLNDEGWTIGVIERPLPPPGPCGSEEEGIREWQDSTGTPSLKQVPRKHSGIRVKPRWPPESAWNTHDPSSCKQTFLSLTCTVLLRPPKMSMFFSALRRLI